MKQQKIRRYITLWSTFILLTNLVLTFVIFTHIDIPDGVGFVFVFLFIPGILILSGILFVLVRVSRLQYTTKRTLLFTYSILITLPMYLYAFLAEEHPTVEIFNCGEGRTIVLSSDSLCEITCPLYYQAYVDGEEQTPLRFIYGYDAYSVDSQLISCANGQLAAVTTTTSPFTPFLIHDFRTGKSWPYQDNQYATLRVMLDRECPELKVTKKLQDSDYLFNSETLDLGYSSISDTDLLRLPRLQNIRRLSLAHTAITDHGLAFLANTPKLGELDLAATSITNQGLSTYCRNASHKIAAFRGHRY
jgi:hypothetical protein